MLLEFDPTPEFDDSELEPDLCSDPLPWPDTVDAVEPADD